MPSPSAKPRFVHRRRALVLSLMAGLVAVQCGNPPSSNPTTPSHGLAAQAGQVCTLENARSSDRFSLAHGCITYSDGSKLWAVDPNHAGNRILLGPSNGLAPMAWSRDGSRLLLIGPGTTSNSDLYVMSADGSQKRLTTDGLSGPASFSPDGTKVVFQRGFDGLFVVDVKGGTPELAVRSYVAWWVGSPAWSPDGRIAYAVYLEGGPQGHVSYEIWTAKPDGSGPRRLADLGECRAACAGGLAWSPDGSTLAFHSAQGTGNPSLAWAIYVVHSDGSGLRRITDRYGDFQPAWSPDGSRIAFTQDTSDGNVFTIAPDGSDMRRVEGIADRPHGSIGVFPHYGLAWNPVG